MKTEMDWQIYIKTTRRQYIKRYAKCAKENTRHSNVLRNELDNILEAANRGREQRLYKVTLEIARWLWIEGGRFLDLQGYTQIGIQLLTQALDAARLSKDKAEEEELLGQMGRAWLAAGNLEIASQYFQEALKLAEKIDDRRGMASHLGCLGQIYLDQRDKQKAEESFQRALTLAKEIANQQLEGRLLGSLGLLIAGKGRYSEAIGYYQSAISIAEKEKDEQGKASHLGAMGIAYKFLGLGTKPEKRQASYQGEMVNYPYEYLDDSQQKNYYHQAKECFEQALSIARKIGDKKQKKEYEENLNEVKSLSRDYS